MTRPPASKPAGSSTAPARPRSRARRPGPGRFLFPAAVGLALLAWALELGRDRKRNTGPSSPGGPLLDAPAAATPADGSP